jgi:hypothetical protein
MVSILFSEAARYAGRGGLVILSPFAALRVNYAKDLLFLGKGKSRFLAALGMTERGAKSNAGILCP